MSYKIVKAPRNWPKKSIDGQSFERKVINLVKNKDTAYEICMNVTRIMNEISRKLDANG